jgi:alpha-N-acetyl-neuraminate alpha-2,8-sialyltransferase (sialyltransferase 8D)
MQEKIYHNKLVEGPKLIEDYINHYHVDKSSIFYTYDNIKNILQSDPEVKGDYIFDDKFFSEIKNIIDSEFDYEFKNKTCAIIGNSPVLLESELGKQIDDYDIVIRCNHGPTEGYEQHVGSKTNFRVVSSKVFGYDEITSLSKFDHEYLSNLDDQHFIIKLPLNRFPNHALHGFQKNFGGSNKVSVMKDAFQQTIKQSVGGVEPSTGIFGLILFLCFVDKIDIYGFDFYSERGKTNKLHYFEDVNHVPGSHNFDTELNIVDSLVQSNRVTLY